MDKATVDIYSNKAGELAGRYESSDMSAIHHLLLRHLPAKACVLEIGCGSGRESAFLLRHGYDVTAVDASAAMITEAVRLHPELHARVRCAAVPLGAEDPLLAQHFDAIVAIATVMHVSDHELSVCALQFAQMLRPYGVLFVSTSLGRQGIGPS